MRPGERTYTIVSTRGELYTVRLAFKHIKSFNIRVASDGSVKASAPCSAPEVVVRDFLQSRADWVEAAVKRQRALAAARPRDNIENGGTVRIHGRAVAVNVTSGKKNRVELHGDELWVAVRDTADAESVKKAVLTWQKRAALEFLTQLTAEYLPAFARYGVCEMPKISVKTMKTRWGSCSYDKGRVSYNTALLAVPTECARYVVVHELAHFVYHDHSPRFHALTAEVLPGAAQYRKKLKSERLG